MVMNGDVSLWCVSGDAANWCVQIIALTVTIYAYFIVDGWRRTFVTIWAVVLFSPDQTNCLINTVFVL
jgi:hypothetical protein